MRHGVPALSKALTIAAVGGGLYWAHRNGHMPPPVAAFLDDVIDRVTAWIDGPHGIDVPGQLQPGSTWPASAETPDIDSLGKVFWERALLEQNRDLVGSWASRNLDVTAGLMHHESGGGRNPKVKGPVIAGGVNRGHRAHGLMQVMPLTAQDLYAKGWTRLKPTRANLLTVRGSIYFGTAYLDWLDRNHPGNTVHMLRAYNGGPGYPNLRPGSANYAQNSQYPQHVLNAAAKLGSMA